MVKLTEHDILAPFIGKTVNPDTFTKVAYKTSGGHLICNADYMDMPPYCELFGITDRLKEIWEYSGVDFTIHLVIEDGNITKAYLDKLSVHGAGHGRPITKVLSISQQELRVARRILQYITN
jgi:hypothetical protein